MTKKPTRHPLPKLKLASSALRERAEKLSLESERLKAESQELRASADVLDAANAAPAAEEVPRPNPEAAREKGRENGRQQLRQARLARGKGV